LHPVLSIARAQTIVWRPSRSLPVRNAKRVSYHIVVVYVMGMTLPAGHVGRTANRLGEAVAAVRL
jgi:hypothetical protein